MRSSLMKRQLWYKAIVRDRNGKVLLQEEKKSRSFLKQWNQLVACQMVPWSSFGWPSIKATSGADWCVGIGTHGYNLRMNGPANNDIYGIVIGTDGTAVNVSDYRMGSQIHQGIGPEQMDHLVCSIASSVVADPNCDFLVSRSFANNSGGSITVRESGIYVWMERCVSPFNWYDYACVVRDVFGSPQAVPDGGGITINYTLRVTE